MRVQAISGERRVHPSGTLTAYVPTPASQPVHSRSTSRTVASRASACTCSAASEASDAGSAADDAAAKAGGRDAKCPNERATERTPARAAARAAPTVPELCRCVRTAAAAQQAGDSRQGKGGAGVAAEVRPAQHKVDVKLIAVRSGRSAVAREEASRVEQPDVRRRRGGLGATLEWCATRYAASHSLRRQPATRPPLPRQLRGAQRSSCCGRARHERRARAGSSCGRRHQQQRAKSRSLSSRSLPHADGRERAGHAAPRLLWQTGRA